MSSITVTQHRWGTQEFCPALSGCKFPLVFADPPYNYKVKYDGDKTNDNLTLERYKSWLWAAMHEIFNHVEDGGMLFWLGPPEHGPFLWDFTTQLGPLIWDIPIIWYESFSQHQSKRLTKDYRLLFPIIKGTEPKTWNPLEIRVESGRQKLGDRRAKAGGKVPGHLWDGGTVWDCPRLPGNAHARVDWHKAQLHPGPLTKILKGFSCPGDHILDAFGGSGSMIEAVKLLGSDRKLVLTDQSEAYCLKMRKRAKV